MDIGNNNQMRVNPLDLPNVECEKCENMKNQGCNMRCEIFLAAWWPLYRGAGGF